MREMRILGETCSACGYALFSYLLAYVHAGYYTILVCK